MIAEKIIKPSKLSTGDTIGIVSPASSLHPLMEGFLKRGIDNLQHLGFKIKFAENALKYEDALLEPAFQRADDLNRMFSDPEVKAIFCLCGGYSENVYDTLNLLNWSSIECNPKIVMGYSANTVLLLGINKRTNMVTFHGPHLLNGLSEYPEPFPYTLNYLERLLFQTTKLGSLDPSVEWTSDFPKGGQPRDMKLNPGWKWLRSGKANGRLVGGNLGSIQTVLGTEYCPTFSSKVLFLEEVYMGDPILQRIDASLKALIKSNIFDEISGLVVGKINDISSDEENNFFDLLMQHTKAYDFPILAQVDIGHTDPKITMPIGLMVTLDSATSLFSFDEPAVINY